MDPEIADIDLNDPELEKAATKIQATFKGFKARRQEREDVDAAAKELGSAATSLPPTKEPVDETIDIDLNDPEVEKAATKIQATFKGYKARREARAPENADS